MPFNFDLLDVAIVGCVNLIVNGLLLPLAFKIPSFTAGPKKAPLQGPLQMIVYSTLTVKLSLHFTRHPERRFAMLNGNPALHVWAKTAILCAIATAALLVRDARAQEATRAITGTISDSSGSVVPGAQIALVNVSTSVTKTTVSTGTGVYVFPNVRPGQYTLQVSKAGFEQVNQRDITLAVNQTATFDITLRVGSVGQTITVEANAAQVNTATDIRLRLSASVLTSYESTSPVPSKPNRSLGDANPATI